MVCDGSSQARAAKLVAGTTTSNATAIFAYFMCPPRSGIQCQGHGPELGLALGGSLLRGLDRPLERNAHRLAAADFSHRPRAERLLTGLEVRERPRPCVKLQVVLARRTRRAGEPVDRPLHVASAAPPP